MRGPGLRGCAACGIGDVRVCEVAKPSNGPWAEEIAVCGASDTRDMQAQRLRCPAVDQAAYCVGRGLGLGLLLL